MYPEHKLTYDLVTPVLHDSSGSLTLAGEWASMRSLETAEWCVLLVTMREEVARLRGPLISRPTRGQPFIKQYLDLNVENMMKSSYREHFRLPEMDY